MPASGNRISGAEVRKALVELGWSQAELERRSGVTQVTTVRWAASGGPPLLRAFLESELRWHRLHNSKPVNSALENSNSVV